MPPSAAASGQCRSSPCRRGARAVSSRLISRPTTRKKIAISPSFIQCRRSRSTRVPGDRDRDAARPEPVIRLGPRRVRPHQRGHGAERDEHAAGALGAEEVAQRREQPNDGGARRCGVGSGHVVLSMIADQASRLSGTKANCPVRRSRGPVLDPRVVRSGWRSVSAAPCERDASAADGASAAGTPTVTDRSARRSRCRRRRRRSRRRRPTRDHRRRHGWSCRRRRTRLPASPRGGGRAVRRPTSATVRISPGVTCCSASRSARIGADARPAARPRRGTRSRVATDGIARTRRRRRRPRPPSDSPHDRRASSSARSLTTAMSATTPASAATRTQ